jgi:hypothetical protein
MGGGGLPYNCAQTLKTFYTGIFLDTEASEARSSYTVVNTAHHSQFLPF